MGFDFVAMTDRFSIWLLRVLSLWCTSAKWPALFGQGRAGGGKGLPACGWLKDHLAGSFVRSSGSAETFVRIRVAFDTGVCQGWRVRSSSSSLKMPRVAPAPFSAYPHTSFRYAIGSEEDGFGDFLSFPSMGKKKSALCTAMFSFVITTTVCLPLSENERHLQSTILRGLATGCLACFCIAPVFLVIAPVVVCGKFHRRYLNCVPIALLLGIGSAFIPSGKNIRLGFMPTMLISYNSGFLFCLLFLNGPLFHSAEHKALDKAFGPPQMIAILLFCGTVIGYNQATRVTSNPLVGLLLPVGCFLTEVTIIQLLEDVFMKKCFQPKLKNVFETIKARVSGTNGPKPSILGDQEANFGMVAAFFSLLFENAKIVATIAEVAYQPSSTAWKVGLVVSFLSDTAKRSGLWNHFLVKLFSLANINKDLASVTSIHTTYLRAQGSCGYVALSVVVSLGCARWVVFGDPRSIIWLDVNSTVPLVILMTMSCQAAQDILLLMLDRYGFVDFPISSAAKFIHECIPISLDDEAAPKRELSWKGHLFVFCSGTAAILAILVVLLGPIFIFGVCKNIKDISPTSTNLWTSMDQAPTCQSWN